ncbi:pentapeptide repeat-containing protein [Dictyobacter aurantiacus]|uniref:pentapeptide repeat-containing protein n=1 Tax=Dictyobacter aurantiacus TaxID=1936993 RepID=UPI001C3F56CC|nr:pentapeptide repeat-containing protein [Dictyobacter aurantiacus]
MASKFGIWWQKIQQHPFIVMGIIVPLMALLVLALAVHRWGWNWTGFAPYFSPPGTQYNDVPRGKTLWDWLGLLIIPLMLALGGFWLNERDKDRDKRVAEQQYKADCETRADNHREAMLQTYFEKMAELLLEKKLRDAEEEEEVRKIARVRTFIVLRRLDVMRKAAIIRGLHDFGLIDKDKSVVSLNGAHLSGVDLSGVPISRAHLGGADLSKANLSRAKLSEADLSEADLSEADLSRANLSGANLSEANLSEVDLSRANLSEANLSGADLSGTDLFEADLSRANLSGTDLSGADLSNAIVTEEQLKEARSLQGTIMPDGSKHPH